MDENCGFTSAADFSAPTSVATLFMYPNTDRNSGIWPSVMGTMTGRMSPRRSGLSVVSSSIDVIQRSPPPDTTPCALTFAMAAMFLGCLVKVAAVCVMCTSTVLVAVWPPTHVDRFPKMLTPVSGPGLSITMEAITCSRAGLWMIAAHGVRMLESSSAIQCSGLSHRERMIAMAMARMNGEAIFFDILRLYAMLVTLSCAATRPYESGSSSSVIGRIQFLERGMDPPNGRT